MSMNIVGRWLPILTIGLALAGCGTEGASVTPDDPGFKAMATGDYSSSQNEFQSALASKPHDPYLELDLGVAYQNMGRLDLAEALYRQAMTDGKDVVPPYTTYPRDAGKSIAQIACENIAIGHKTQRC
jgi:tetratricopeptide (TPR) repeat protein